MSGAWRNPKSRAWHSEVLHRGGRVMLSCLPSASVHCLETSRLFQKNTEQPGHYRLSLPKEHRVLDGAQGSDTGLPNAYAQLCQVTQLLGLMFP